MDSGGRWESQRGDEWWYSMPGLTARGEFVPGSSAMSIGSVSGGISARSLHAMLIQTLDQFPGTEPRVLLTAATRPILAELAAAGVIRIVELVHPFSVEARVTVLAASHAAT